MFNNKGDRELSIGTLLLLLLGIIVLVIIVVSFTGVWDYIFGTVKLLPGDSEKVAQVCKFDVSSELKTDYCLFKEVEKGIWLNCLYPELNLGPDERKPEWCNRDIDKPLTKCLELNRTSTNFNPKKVSINGITCEQLMREQQNTQEGTGTNEVFKPLLDTYPSLTRIKANEEDKKLFEDAASGENDSNRKLLNKYLDLSGIFDDPEGLRLAQHYLST